MEDFPQVYITKRFKHEGARYFGPFASAGLVRKTLDLPDPSQRMLASLPKDGLQLLCRYLEGAQGSYTKRPRGRR